jgi:hypothetical protein
LHGKVLRKCHFVFKNPSVRMCRVLWGVRRERTWRAQAELTAAWQARARRSRSKPALVFAQHFAFATAAYTTKEIVHDMNMPTTFTRGALWLNGGSTNARWVPPRPCYTRTQHLHTRLDRINHETADAQPLRTFLTFQRNRLVIDSATTYR